MQQSKVNKNAFQLDAYRPLVARISQHAHALLLGGVPARGVYLSVGGVPAQVLPP